MSKINAELTSNEGSKWFVSMSILINGNTCRKIGANRYGTKTRTEVINVISNADEKFSSSSLSFVDSLIIISVMRLRITNPAKICSENAIDKDDNAIIPSALGVIVKMLLVELFMVSPGG